MSNLTIPGSQSTPTIDGDWDAGLLTLKGDSYPENSFDLFNQVINWVERYLATTDKPLNLELSLLYLNTSSIRAVMDIFDMLEDAHAEGRSVSVNWHYDHRNERVAELAEEFKEDCTFPFSIVAHE